MKLTEEEKLLLSKSFMFITENEEDEAIKKGEELEAGTKPADKVVADSKSKLPKEEKDTGDNIPLPPPPDEMDSNIPEKQATEPEVDPELSISDVKDVEKLTEVFEKIRLTKKRISALQKELNFLHTESVVDKVKQLSYDITEFTKMVNIDNKDKVVELIDKKVIKVLKELEEQLFK